MNPRWAIVLGFNCFCLGAMLAEHLMKAGVQYLSLWLGLPALVIQVLLLNVIREHKK